MLYKFAIETYGVTLFYDYNCENIMINLNK